MSKIDADVPPLDIPKDCEPFVAYGPPPCTSDADCQTYGADWYCGAAQSQVIDTCGTKVDRRVCTQATDVVTPDTPADVAIDCPPMGWYGPPPCTSDAECQDAYGADWVCNQNNPVDDGCGGTVNYPVCQPKTP